MCIESIERRKSPSDKEICVECGRKDGGMDEVSNGC